MLRPNHANLVTQSNSDNSNVDVKIKIYYTTAFKDTFGDSDLVKMVFMQQFVDNMLAKTNVGFRNSNVKITAYQHEDLEELTTVAERTGPDAAVDTLEAFKGSKGDVSCTTSFPSVNLRAGADAAALLVSAGRTIGACGIATQNGITNGQTTFLVAKDCVDNYSFGHELGHNFGLQHNIENAIPTVYHPDGYGYWVDDFAGAPAGIRTIMAYPDNAGLYPERVNYYSNKDLDIDHNNHWWCLLGAADLGSGYPGKSADNAAVLNRMRFSFAQIGKNIYIA